MKELEEISNYLKKTKQTLSIAESCTGGLVSSYFTDVPGASNFILKNFVTYSESAKIEFLNISPKTLENFGVISEDIAREMACGLTNFQGADFGISTTGILGPDDLEFNGQILPKGLVYIGVANKNKTKVLKYISSKNSRIDIKKDIVETAIKFFNDFIKENP